MNEKKIEELKKQEKTPSRTKEEINSNYKQERGENCASKIGRKRGKVKENNRLKEIILVFLAR